MNNNQKFYLLVVIFCFCFTRLSFASDSAIYCEHATSDYDMGPCSARDFNKSTEDLERIESRLRKILYPNKQALRIFELDTSDWKQYMLNRCSDAVLGFDPEGSSITSSIARGYCKADLMSKRVITLKRYTK